jgi:hypothetical protein
LCKASCARHTAQILKFSKPAAQDFVKSQNAPVEHWNLGAKPDE